MTDTSAAARRVLVYVAVPPRAMLLDIAGPLEVLRRANMEQAKIFFDVKYVSPARQTAATVCGDHPTCHDRLPSARQLDTQLNVVGCRRTPTTLAGRQTVPPKCSRRETRMASV